MMAYPLASIPEPEPAPLLRVFVPGNPVSVNQAYLKRWRATGRAKHDRTLTPFAVTWRESITLAVLPWRFPERGPRPRLSIECIFIGGRADVDNLLKLALDGIKDGLMVDDRFVMRIVAEKQPLPRGGQRGAWIAVTLLPPATKPQRVRRPRKRTTA